MLLNMVGLLKSEHINMWTSVLPHGDEFDDVHKDYKCLASLAKKSHDRNACTCVKWCINTRLFIAAISIIAKDWREPPKILHELQDQLHKLSSIYTTECITAESKNKKVCSSWCGKTPRTYSRKDPFTSLFTFMCIVCCFLLKSF